MPRRQKTRYGLIVAFVAAFLSGAALAFYYAYSRPMCYITLYPPQRQALPLETSIDTKILLPDGEYHLGKDCTGGRME